MDSIEYRRASPNDAAAMAALMSDPAVFAGLMQMPYPSVERWRKRLEQQVEQKDGLHLLAIDQGQVIASAGVHAAAESVRARHVASLGICIARERHGQGIGSELMKRLLDWCDNWAGYLRVELNVYTDNERAIALYRRFGFLTEGTHRAHVLRDGVFVDSFSMARLHPSPPRLPDRT